MSPAPTAWSVPLGPGGEFEAIRRFVSPGRTRHPAVTVGPGDDAAVLEGGWVVSTDLSVEDVHFRRGWLGDEEVGGRAVRAALSDLAAMAAHPVGVLVSLALPRGGGVDPDAVMAGVREAAEAYGASLIGGDLSGSPGPLVLDVVVLGRAASPCLRAGGCPGDEVWVTGNLGGSAAAVRLWERGDTPAPGLRAAFARPVPRIAEALELAAAGVLHALIDLSDGLAGDAGHLAAAGGVRVVLEEERIPVSPAAREALGGGAALEAALHGGEDYELCFAAAPGAVDAAISAAMRGVRLTRVGRLEEGRGVWLETPEGELREVTRGGFDHLEGEGG